MKIDGRILRILGRAQDGFGPSREECLLPLDCPTASVEASVTRGVADSINRQRFRNQGLLQGQIGIERGACAGDCGFCSFAESLYRAEPDRMPVEEILAAADCFAASGDLAALSLMTMHNPDFDRLADLVHAVRRRIPEQMQIVVNAGDFDYGRACVLREAGVDGAYHICRLREGVDTRLGPDARKATIKAIKDAGLDLYYCCEPIGPEHASAELVEQLFLGIEFGCFQHAAMRRVHIPGTRLASCGQISELRLAQVTAVVALACLACREIQSVAVHEPNLIGLTSGANAVWAEIGSNPREPQTGVSSRRGFDVSDCRSMLHEAGFDSADAHKFRQGG